MQNKRNKITQTFIHHCDKMMLWQSKFEKSIRIRIEPKIITSTSTIQTKINKYQAFLVLIFRLILPRTKQKVKKRKMSETNTSLKAKLSIFQALSLSLSWLVARVLGVCLDAGIKSGRCFLRKVFLGMAGYCFV